MCSAAYSRTITEGHDRLYPNHFARMYKDGRMLIGATVESRNNKDDDWIEFRFDAPDPAARPLS